VKHGHYYNEFDPHAAAWLRELVREGHLPEGEVDERDIREVRPADLAGFRACHFFCGIAGWERALQLAGWDYERDGQAWTGSCPCPPFSAAGKKKHCPECRGKSLVPCPRRTGYFICAGCEHAWLADERHLWPEFWRLVRECRPATVFGEQVSGKDGLLWFAGVRASLEIIGYRAGAVDIPVAGAGEETEGWVCYDDGEGNVDYVRERIVVSAPHIRQRIFWCAQRVADPQRERDGDDGLGPTGGEAAGVQEADGERQRVRSDARKCRRVVFGFDERSLEPLDKLREQGRIGDDCLRVASIVDAARAALAADAAELERLRVRVCAVLDGVADAKRTERRAGDERGCDVVHGDHGAGEEASGGPGVCGVARGVFHPASDGRREGRSEPDGSDVDAARDACGVGDSGCNGREQGSPGSSQPQSDAGRAGHAFWSDFAVVHCRDGKARRVSTEPALFPLAPRIPGRVGLLRGSGNAINPVLAAEFVRAFLEVEAER
jgi:DNA (cytosine-5)-methyltransferase 1